MNHLTTRMGILNPVNRDTLENWGTPRYRACIKILLDECDAKHKSPQGLGLKATPERKPLSLRLN